MTWFLTALATCIALVVAATTAQADDNKNGAVTKIDGNKSVTKDVAPPSPLPLPYPTTGTTTKAPAPNAGTGVPGGNSAVVEPAHAASNAKPRDAASGIATGKRQHAPVRSP